MLLKIQYVRNVNLMKTFYKYHLIFSINNCNILSYLNM